MPLQFSDTIPLSLYIHLPWCVRKCPYCDFNSHNLKQDLPEANYINALLDELEQKLPTIWGRRIISIFMGGGTPSLFSGAAIEQLLSGLQQRLSVLPDAEITMEANPGTAEQARFAAYRAAGVNRLSLGVQSFADAQLKKLGRIHNAHEAEQAVAMARTAGFDNFNIDLMYGLPAQTIEDTAAADDRSRLRRAAAAPRSRLGRRLRSRHERGRRAPTAGRRSLPARSGLRRAIRLPAARATGLRPAANGLLHRTTQRPRRALLLPPRGSRHARARAARFAAVREVHSRPRRRRLPRPPRQRDDGRRAPAAPHAGGRRLVAGAQRSMTSAGALPAPVGAHGPSQTNAASVSCSPFRSCGNGAAAEKSNEQVASPLASRKPRNPW